MFEETEFYLQTRKRSNYKREAELKSLVSQLVRKMQEIPERPEVCVADHLINLKVYSVECLVDDLINRWVK